MATKNPKRAKKAKAAKRRSVTIKRGKYVATATYDQTGLAEPPRATYQEGRYFKTGKAWLGYLEGRPGIIMPALDGTHTGRLPRGKAKPAPVSRAARAEARRRIEDCNPVQCQPTAKARKKLAAQLFQTWLLAERFGAYVQTIVDNDSQTPDHNEDE